MVFSDTKVGLIVVPGIMMFGRMVKIGHAVVVRAAVWGGMGIWEWWMTRREVDGALVRWCAGG
jgi:hypothetical protein